MTTTATEKYTMPAPVREAEAAAIEALTRAVRESGRFQWRADMPDAAALIGRIVTATVANLGSLEALPGRAKETRETDLVRGMVETTLSGGELLNWRSEPLDMYVDPQEVFESLGLDKIRDADWDAASARIQATRRFIGKVLRGIGPDGEDCEWLEEADSPEATEAERIHDEIDTLYFDDGETYVETYARTVEAIATEQGITVPVRVHKGDVDELIGGKNAHNDGTAELHHLARQRTPLPQLNRAPGDIEGPVLDALRAAGRTYAERVVTA